MKTLLSLITVLTLFLTACGSAQPLTEEQQAASYGMTIERYREEKSAAARMGMSWEDHVKMIQGDGGMNHNMHR